MTPVDFLSSGWGNDDGHGSSPEAGCECERACVCTPAPYPGGRSPGIGSASHLY